MNLFFKYIMQNQRLYLLVVCLLNLLLTNVQAQTLQSNYLRTYSQIKDMLLSEDSLNFKNAVLLTENVYLGDKIDKNAFNDIIWAYASICRGISKSENIIYSDSDKEKAIAQCAVLHFLCDSTPVYLGTEIVIHSSFIYNHEDFAGQKDWSNMFVSTLMQTKKATVTLCHICIKSSWTN